MTDEKSGWSEKGKAGGDKGSSAESGDDKARSAAPSRPSTRASSAGADKAASTVVRRPSTDAGARKVAKAAATAGQRDVSFASRMGFPAVVGLVCLLGLGAVFYAWTTREALASPVQNLDHWHGVYGVYNCNLLGEGDAKYLPPFQSGQDETGIHSHGDGLLHIHPFFELSSGDNAQLRHFFSEMQVEVTSERITVNNGIDPSVDLVAGEECADGTGPAEIKVLKWKFDFEATADDRKSPEVIETDPGQIRFDNDREVYIIAYVGANTDLDEIPLPPQDRFDLLNNVSASIDYEPTQLNPIDTGVTVTGEDEDGNPVEAGTDEGGTDEGGTDEGE